MAVTRLVEELPEACNLNTAIFAHTNVLSQSPELSKYHVINHPGAAGKLRYDDADWLMAP